MTDKHIINVHDYYYMLTIRWQWIGMRVKSQCYSCGGEDGDMQALTVGQGGRYKGMQHNLFTRCVGTTHVNSHTACGDHACNMLTATRRVEIMHVTC